MAIGRPVQYVNVPAERLTETPAADWTGGANPVAGNNNGIGIALDGGSVRGTPDDWTLLDQDGQPRTPQSTQYIGEATPAPITDSEGLGEEATLADVAVGWTGVVPPP
jgi:hypothetical protein